MLLNSSIGTDRGCRGLEGRPARGFWPAAYRRPAGGVLPARECFRGSLGHVVLGGLGFRDQKGPIEASGAVLGRNEDSAIFVRHDYDIFERR